MHFRATGIAPRVFFGWFGYHCSPSHTSNIVDRTYVTHSFKLEISMLPQEMHHFTNLNVACFRNTKGDCGCHLILANLVFVFSLVNRIYVSSQRLNAMWHVLMVKAINFFIYCICKNELIYRNGSSILFEVEDSL